MESKSKAKDSAGGLAVFGSFIALFSSASTLVCCALPALMVSFGFGASFAALTSAVPQLIFISEHKNVVFAIAAVCLTFGFIAERRIVSCPADPELGRACARTRAINAFVLRGSAALLGIGGFFAYVAPLIV